MANVNNMNRILEFEGKWIEIEYESEVLWVEQRLKPSKRSQLVARMLKALIGQKSAKRFSGEDAARYLDFSAAKG